MKKIYSLSLAALALCAVATNANAEATTADKMTGNYLWRFYNNYKDNKDLRKQAQVDTVSIAAVEGQANKVTVTGLAGKGVSVQGTLNPEQGTLTIPRTVLAEATDAKGEKYTPILESLELINADDMWVEPTKGDIVLDFHKGVYTMTATKGIGVGKYATADAATPSDHLIRRIACTLWSGDLNWEKLGTTEYTDNYLTLGLGKNPVAKTVTVYGIEGVDVFKVEGALASLGENTEPMLINAIDPNFVRIPVQNSGFVDASYNNEVQLDANDPSTKRKFTGEVWYTDMTTVWVNMAYDSSMAITYKDGVITFPGFVQYNIPNGYDKTMGCASGYQWTSKYKQTKATLNIPRKQSAVEGIDNENAPVEYFNLQGVKVANPDHGIFIRRQGTRTTKVIL